MGRSLDERRKRAQITGENQDNGWAQLAGVAWLTGIGFTMSLFIGGLAFDSAALLNEVRLGVIAGSIASAIAGCAIIAAATKRNGAPAGATPAAA